MSALVAEVGNAVNLTATGTIAPRTVQLLGFYVHSTSSGTIVLRRGAGGTSGGTAIGSTITPAVGYHKFPMDCPEGAHATIGGTIDVTFFVA